MNDKNFRLFLYIMTLAIALIMVVAFSPALTCNGGESGDPFSLSNIVPALLFWLWSALPLAAFALFLRFRFRPADTLFKKIYILALFLVLAVFPGSIHFMWILDAGGIASGSSTSAIIFIFIPLWSIVLMLMLVILLEAVRLVFFRERKR